MPPTLARAPLLAIALLTMLWGTWLGLARLGWGLPLPATEDVLWHGPLLVGGFFGTLITLERAVAVGARWGYAGPALTVAGAVLLATGSPSAGALAIAGGSLVLVVGAVVIAVRRQSAPAWVAVAGAAVWLAGNVQWWLGAAVYEVAYWWAGFLILTIVGTRLGRLQPWRFTKPAAAWLSAGLLLLIAGILLSTIAPDAGVRALGAGLIVLAAWLARHDAARRTARQPGLDGYMAVGVLAAYTWLAAGGLMAMAFGGVTIGPRYDAVLHAVLLGFVLSMVFVHAPLVFPAILGVPLPYRPAFYAHLALLHVSLLLRVMGDLVPELTPLRAWGALLNAVAILLFVANTARSALLARRPAPSEL
jgi:hypothetical protein